MDWAMVFLSMWLAGGGVQLGMSGGQWVMLWGSAQSLGFSTQSASICTQPWGWLAMLYAWCNVLMPGFDYVLVL